MLYFFEKPWFSVLLFYVPIKGEGGRKHCQLWLLDVMNLKINPDGNYINVKQVFKCKARQNTVLLRIGKMQ